MFKKGAIGHRLHSHRLLQHGSNLPSNAGGKNRNRLRFQTIPACDLINLTSLIALIGSIYVESI